MMAITRPRGCSQNLCSPFLRAVRLFIYIIYIIYITRHNFSPTRSVIYHVHASVCMQSCQALLELRILHIAQCTDDCCDKTSDCMLWWAYTEYLVPRSVLQCTYDCCDKTRTVVGSAVNCDLHILTLPHESFPTTYILHYCRKSLGISRATVTFTLIPKFPVIASDPLPYTKKPRAPSR